MASEQKVEASQQVENTINWVKSLHSADDSKHKDEREVLPSNIRPKHYFISYTSIDLVKEFTFNGRAEIDLNIKAESNEIKFNSAEIEYKKITVTQSDDTQTIDVAKLVYDKKV